jgi:DNA polymerase-4
VRARPVILHLDLDAFFSAVEQLHKPSLRGKPVVVGGIGRRGVVSTASYEARAFGIGSAMAMGEARRRCPNAAYLAPRFGAYRAVSQVVMGLLAELSPLVEQVSVDEAYVDLTPAHPDLDVAGVTALATGLRARIRAATGLTASVGASTSKLMSKIGSELAKPDGLTVVPPGAEAATLAPLPVRAIPGVGPATRDRLHLRGLDTVGQVAAAPEAELVELLGQAHGSQVHRYATGADDRPVVPERDAKSVSAETTFEVDLTDPRRLAQHARELAARVTARLAAEGTSGRTVTLKLRRHDFTQLTRSQTLDQPTDSPQAISQIALALLAAIDVTDGIRLLGVGVSGLTGFAQQDLLAGLEPEPPDELPDAEEPPDDAGAAAVADLATADRPGLRRWWPGQDVVHTGRGPGWVQGTGVGRVTVRFEGPDTPPGPIATFAVDDPDLAPADPPAWTPTTPAP